MRKLLRTIRRSFRLDQAERMMFYALLSAQLRGGLVPARACSVLEHLDGLSSGIRDVAKAGSQAAREGRTELDGIAETGLLPDDDVSVLMIADRYDQLPDALDDLVRQQEAELGFLARVVAPNLYFGMITALATAFVWHAESFFSRLGGISGGSNVLLDLSATLKEVLPGILIATGLVIVLIAYGRNVWTGALRRLLGPFDRMSRLQSGIRIAALAERLSRRGAVDVEILDALRDICGDNRYLRIHVRRAKEAIVTRGELWEDVLGQGLLLPEHADLLRGLVPGSDLQRYPDGYRAIGRIQSQLLRRKLEKWQQLVKLGLLVLLFFLLSRMVEGMFSLMGGAQSAF